MDEKEKSGSWQDTVSDWLISIIVAVVLAFGIRTFLVEPYMVSGPSMMNTLQDQAAGEQAGVLHQGAQTGRNHRFQISQ